LKGGKIIELDFNVFLSNDNLLDNRLNHLTLVFMGEFRPTSIQVTSLMQDFITGKEVDFKEVNFRLKLRNLLPQLCLSFLVGAIPYPKLIIRDLGVDIEFEDLIHLLLD